MEKISFCSIDKITNLQQFINNSWKKEHILSKNIELLDFQHKTIDKYNFVIAENEHNQITAILGFIPTSLYDRTIDSNSHIWLALWKADDTIASPGIGILLLKWLEKELNPLTIGIIGINDKVEKIYKLLGYKTGILNHYYFTNPNVINFKIAVNAEIKYSACTKQKHSIIKEIDLSEVTELFLSVFPEKSIKYLKNRYQNHPFYKYHIVSIITDNKIVAVFVFRKIEVQGSTCIRIVDIVGNYNKINNLEVGLSTLLQQYSAEYIDCLNYGLDEQQFVDWGFTKRMGYTIIPNYFEPFERKNIDVKFAFKSTSDYIIFKADGDQDRPN